jgi:hypothetical protein
LFGGFNRKAHGSITDILKRRYPLLSDIISRASN